MTVLVPLIVPSIASAAVLAGFSAWGELMFASTFLTDQGKWPASVQLEQLVSNPEATIPIVMAVLDSLQPSSHRVLSSSSNAESSPV